MQVYKKEVNFASQKYEMVTMANKWESEALLIVKLKAFI